MVDGQKQCKKPCLANLSRQCGWLILKAPAPANPALPLANGIPTPEFPWGVKGKHFSYLPARR